LIAIGLAIDDEGECEGVVCPFVKVGSESGGIMSSGCKCEGGSWARARYVAKRICLMALWCPTLRLLISSDVIETAILTHYMVLLYP
jgi:hypothetical protein